MESPRYRQTMRSIWVVLSGVCLTPWVSAAEDEGDNPLDWLRSSIPGEPGTDYPIMGSTQETSFSCNGLIFGGYYADLETDCQQYSVCLRDAINPSTLYPVRFLCPNNGLCCFDGCANT